MFVDRCSNEAVYIYNIVPLYTLRAILQSWFYTSFAIQHVVCYDSIFIFELIVLCLAIARDF